MKGDIFSSTILVISRAIEPLTGMRFDDNSDIMSLIYRFKKGVDYG